MDGFVEVAQASDLSDGSMRAVKVGEREILLARVAGRYYASDNRCPHMGGNLSQGKLDGTMVTCPRHASQFDLTDGHVVRWTDWTGVKLAVSKVVRSPRPLRTYPVKVDGNRILIETGKVPAAV